jgi:glucose-1-phosphate thymidylyltransferase
MPSPDAPVKPVANPIYVPPAPDGKPGIKFAPIAIIEKPKELVSNFAIPGIYFYSNTACLIAKELTPSARGELEISDLNNYFISKDSLKYTELSRGTFWMDTGSFQNLVSASYFVSIAQSRQGLRIGSPEEVAYGNGWINDHQYRQLVQKYSKSGYLNQI